MQHMAPNVRTLIGGCSGDRELGMDLDRAVHLFAEALPGLIRLDLWGNYMVQGERMQAPLNGIIIMRTASNAVASWREAQLGEIEGVQSWRMDEVACVDTGERGGL